MELNNKNFSGLMDQYQLVLTKDNSYTLFSKAFNEACHSLSGAYSETVFNYILGCSLNRILDHVVETPFVILEVGFGLGIGAVTFIDYIDSLNLKTNINMTYISLESDESLVQWAIKETKLKNYVDNISVINNNNLRVYKFSVGLIQFNILIGDARKTLPSWMESNSYYKKSLLAIFQDAFSPKKNPCLWTKEWFEFLKSISNENVILSTYTAAKSVRKTMLAAGFSVIDKDGFPPKKSATIAKLKGETSSDLLSSLDRSPAKVLLDINAI